MTRPCRFCGAEWLWFYPDGESNRHDPLKLAGVKTQQGELRHSMRGLKVAMTRELWLPLFGVIERVLRRVGIA